LAIFEAIAGNCPQHRRGRKLQMVLELTRDRGPG